MNEKSMLVYEGSENVSKSFAVNQPENVVTYQPDPIPEDSVWGHRVIIEIGSSSNEIEYTFDNNTLDCEFVIPFDNDTEPNEAEISIYNVARTTRLNIKRGLYISVKAGYNNHIKEDIGLIFTGYISKTEVKRSGVDSKLIIYAIDDQSFENRNITEKTYPANTKASQILKDLVLSINLPIAVFEIKSDYTYKQAVKVDGSITDCIKKFSEVCEVDVYINKQKIYVHDVRTASKDIDFTCSVETGMINSPEPFTEEKEVTLEQLGGESGSGSLSVNSGDVINKALAWAKQTADDNSHGYSQASRWGPDYDCSSFVISAYQAAGAGVKTAGANATASMYNPFIKCGFKDITKSINLSTGAGLQPGDVLLTPGSHTEMYYGDGKNIGAHSDYDGKTGDSSGREINIGNYYNHPWKYVLRYSVASSTDGAVNKTVSVPNGLGNTFTYMGWQKITSKSSNQSKLREQTGMNFDSEGFGKINGRYVIAMTTTYGNVGDYVDVYQSNGHIFNCIIGDIKNQNDKGCNKWGHLNGKCVVEFVVDCNSWYNSSWSDGAHCNPGESNFHTDWKYTSDGNRIYVTKVTNLGSYFNGAVVSSSNNESNSNGNPSNEVQPPTIRKNIMFTDNKKNTCAYLVLHTSVGPGQSQETIAVGMKNSGVSAHGVIGPNDVYQCAEWTTLCHHCGNGNSVSIGLEQQESDGIGWNNQTWTPYFTGKKTKDEVKDFHEKMYDVAVRLFAYLSQKFTIPTENIISHDEMRKLKGGTTHTDPTSLWNFFKTEFNDNRWTMDAFRSAVAKMRGGTYANASSDSSSAQSGSVTKTITTHGYKLQMLLQHRLQTGVQIKIDSLDVQGNYAVRNGEHIYNGNELTTEFDVIDNTDRPSLDTTS